MTLGLALDGSGFVRRSRTFDENATESATLADMLAGLGAPCRALAVMDAGIATADNVGWLRAQGYRYLVVSRERERRFDAAAATAFATADLLERFKSGCYRAPPVRRVHIPKNGTIKTRPIGIPTLEDKVLQRAVLMVLEPVYEQDFLNCSCGFQPGRSAQQALEALWKGPMYAGGGWVRICGSRGRVITRRHPDCATTPSCGAVASPEPYREDRFL